jgi:hypothetical protein
LQIHETNDAAELHCVRCRPLWEGDSTSLSRTMQRR